MKNKMPIQDGLTHLSIKLISRLDTNCFDDEDIELTIGLLRIIPFILSELTDEQIHNVFKSIENVDSNAKELKTQIAGIIK